MAKVDEEDVQSCRSLDLGEEDNKYLAALGSKDKVATRHTRHPLGLFSVVAFIVQRVIGTGLFRSPWTVIHGTQSVGMSLVFWAIGALSLLAGTLLYIEFGLTVPRHRIDGRMQSVFRNGGDLNYVAYLVQHPKFLIICVYGLNYIVLASSAANALSFGDYTMFSTDMNTKTKDNIARVLAIIAVTFACAIHAFTRRGGIILNNVLASVKVLIVLTFPIMAICALAGVKDTNNAKSNLNPSTSFDGIHSTMYGYSNAFISVLYAYQGINQANYIISEIDRPRRTFVKGITIAASIVVTLYILTNISYMIVVSRKDQLESPDGIGIALLFLEKMLGAKHGARALAGFTAVSSLGNIIGMTFTSARVKQEVAKEGVIPFAKFFGENRSIFRKKRSTHPDGSTEIEDDHEPTPLGALFLHWCFAMILILATWKAKPSTAYKILVNAWTYSIESFFGCLLGLGMLRLRLFTGWKSVSSMPHWLSISAASVFFLANAFPLVTIWIPPSKNAPESVRQLIPNYPWYMTGLLGWTMLAVGVVYYLGFRFLVPRFGARKGKEFVVDREPVFRTQNGERIQWHEIVIHSWVVKAEPERRSSYVLDDM
ncbi:amino acid transporter [Amniculicola lignicola CBS 123094]|uniref:Amino acid transporter n=1 Tax=Amniculicola lignicola CBS 123094 TaxID=1392246 RepID=A0A6A5WR70_9PLEO|nr:amino acid transporter [Amniculicola lignicola CBS 123094]